MNKFFPLFFQRASQYFVLTIGGLCELLNSGAVGRRQKFSAPVFKLKLLIDRPYISF